MTPYLLFYVENPADSAQAIEAPSASRPSRGRRPSSSSCWTACASASGAPTAWSRHRSRMARTASCRSASTRARRVDRHHAGWQEKGLAVLQAPTEMDFGYTAVASLPGPFRLRVFRPGEMPG